MASNPQPGKKSWLLIGLAGMVISIYLLLPAINKHRKFPYTGEWAKKIARRDGRVVQQSIIFTKDDRCFQVFSDGERLECSYEMQGSAAIVTHKLVHVPLNGKMFTLIVRNKATPARDGAVIYLEPFSGTMIDIDEATAKEVPPTEQDHEFMRKHHSRWEMHKVAQAR
jgi:hypothetical protein